METPKNKEPGSLCTVRGGWCIVCYIVDSICEQFDELPTPKEELGPYGDHHKFWVDLIMRLNHDRA